MKRILATLLVLASSHPALFSQTSPANDGQNPAPTGNALEVKEEPNTGTYNPPDLKTCEECGVTCDEYADLDQYLNYQLTVGSTGYAAHDNFFDAAIAPCIPPSSNGNPPNVGPPAMPPGLRSNWREKPQRPVVLCLASESITDDTFKPSALRFLGDSAGKAWVKKDSNGAIRQILTDEYLTDITAPTADSVRIAVYYRPTIGALDTASGLYSIPQGAQLYRESTISKPAGTTDTLDVTSNNFTNSSTNPKVACYRWNIPPPSATNPGVPPPCGFTTTNGSSTTSQTNATSSSGANGTIGCFRVVTKPASNGAMVTETSQLDEYIDLGNGVKRILRRVEAQGTGVERTTVWTYSGINGTGKTGYRPQGGSQQFVNEAPDPDGAVNLIAGARPLSMVRSDGYWEEYEYQYNPNTRILVVRIWSAWKDSPFGDRANARETTITVEEKQRTVIEKLAGQIVSSSVETLTTNSNERVLREARQTGTGAPLVTEYGYHSDALAEPLKGRLKYIRHSNGTLTRYDYTQVGANLKTTIQKGVAGTAPYDPAATGAVPNLTAGTRVERLTNTFNRVIEESTKDIASGVVLRQMLATAVDPRGRPTHVIHDNDPTDYETFQYSCCGLAVHRARDGTVTSYTKDLLERPLITTTTTGARVVTRSYNYASTSNLKTTTVTTTATGVNGSLVQSTVTDLLGRTVSSTSPGPMGTPETTTYTYSANGLVVTQTNPDGGQIVTTSHADGQIKSVTGPEPGEMAGSATIERHYLYGKHNENGGGETTTVLVANGTGGESTTYADLVGRTYKQTRTAPHGQTAVTLTTFDSRGLPDVVTSSGQPTVKYLYNTEGEQIATWTDRNGDGQFNDTSVAGVKDSCTTSQSDYLPSASAPAGLGTCRRTITSVRIEANEDKIVSTTWQSVDGLRSRQETLGVANPATATRTRPLNGASSSTQTNPDGTSVVTVTSILANGNTQTTSSSYSSLPSQSLLSSVSSISDAMGQTLQTTNGRGHVTQYGYHGVGGQTASITQVNAAPPPTPGNLVTSYSYNLTQGIGRSIETTLPDTSKQYQETNLLGQTTRQWGNQTNPVTFTYDAAGRMATHTTFRTPVNSGSQQTIPSSGDTTRWEYDPSGVHLRKIYADNNKTTYTYDIAGRLATRLWARGITTSYGYTAGQLTSIDYSDATPDVSATYNRLGQLLSATQSGAATSPDADYTFGYNANTLRFASETVTIDPDGSGPLPTLTRTIDCSRDNLQRPTGFVLGNEHAVGYGYDVSGRLATISAQGLPNLPGKSHAFEYTYEPGSSLLDKVTGPVHEVDNTYEAHRNVLSEKKNTRTVGTPGELSVIGYTVNEIGQRVQRNLSGEIRAEFYGGQAGDQYSTGWGYDALGQVTSEDKPSTTADRGYSYDLIGNRLTSTADSVTTSYTSNALNQYSQISVQSVQSVVPIHDQDGNMTTGLLNGSTSGQFDYDGANQLIRTQSTATSSPTNYAYDAFGRRIAKVTYPNAGGQAIAATLFIYDGWNLIAEYKLDSSAWAIDRNYTWGIDLSGSTQGAGGVGGLLSVTKHQAQGTTRFYPIYDGNGNIEAYIDSSGAPAAIYQYDAFGNVLSCGGKGAAVEQTNFSHQFSTKSQDAETGLLYYGYRYYNAVTGRWVNRDPIGQNGGINLYGFINNEGANNVEYLGWLPLVTKEVPQRDSNGESSYEGPEGCMGVNFGRGYTKGIADAFDEEIAKKFETAVGYSPDHPYTAHYYTATYKKATLVAVSKSECDSCSKWAVVKVAKIYSRFWVPYEGTGQQIDEKLKKAYSGQKADNGRPLYNSDMNWKNSEGNFVDAYWQVAPPPKIGEWGKVYAGKPNPSQDRAWREAADSGNDKKFLKEDLRISKSFEFDWRVLPGRCATQNEVDAGAIEGTLDNVPAADWSAPK